jgi:FlaA1/EpsC-like NDP-sugar epimerase
MSHKWVQKMRELVHRLEPIRLPTLLYVDAWSVVASWFFAFDLRFDCLNPSGHAHPISEMLAVCIAVKLSTVTAIGLERRSCRYFSAEDVPLLVIGNLLGSTIAYIAITFIGWSVPNSVWVIDLCLCILFTATTRLAARAFLSVNSTKRRVSVRQRILIFGAGQAGVALLREFRQNDSLKYEVCGFIDDAPEKQGLTIQSVKVLGRGKEILSLARTHAIDIVLIAIPSATGPQMSRILQHCYEANVKFKAVPGLGEIIEGRNLTRQLRPVAFEDLLGRSAVELDENSISGKIHGRAILVTGAAGSIGSELCRQIAGFGAGHIVAFDIAETPLFHLQQEMRRSFPDVPFHPVIGSIQDAQDLDTVFARFEPAIVYHAAAYKHVPIMEHHAFQAIENNVFGTLKLALAAERAAVQDFVMISSDKAVRPTSIMGATKRLAELVIRSRGHGPVKYVAVRFGNVLGSNGSVIPVFKDQIAHGGPVTVTHPDMRRYFMTIPEACQLVLQASTMGKGGEIFVLDMGEPVRIVDLARNLILLSGLRPDEDIKIEFSGIRPGEKLYEELSTLDEGTLPTSHDKINVFAGAALPWCIMENQLESLTEACSARNLKKLVLLLKDLVPEYNPSGDLLREVFGTEEASDSEQLFVTARWEPDSLQLLSS